MHTALTDRIKLVIPLSENDTKIISDLFHLKEIRKGEFFLKEGQTCRQVCFIKKGLFRYYVNLDGEEKTFSFGHEGCFVTDYESFVPQIPSLQNIQALEDSEIFVISKDDLQRFYNEVENAERFGRIAMEYAIIDTVRELKSFYTDNEKERYEGFVLKYPHVQQRIPQYHIASYVGVKPQSLSRIRRRILN